MRIVCLTEETVETLYALGVDEWIVGISGFAVRPPEARKTKPKVSTYLDAKFDEIQKLEPDVVLTWSDLQADIAAELIRRGVEVVASNHRSVEGIYRMIRRLGGYLGIADRADRYASSLEERLDTLRLIGKARTMQPRVYFEEWYDPLITGICWVSELIEVCGGIDVYAEHRTFGAAKDRILTDPLDPVRRNPDLMLASWCGKMFKPQHVRTRAGWEAFPPIVNNHLYEIESPLILQPGPAALTDGVDRMMAIINGWEAAQVR